MGGGGTVHLASLRCCSAVAVWPTKWACRELEDTAERGNGVRGSVYIRAAPPRREMGVAGAKRGGFSLKLPLCLHASGSALEH